MIIIKILVSLLFCLFSMRPIFKAIKRGSFSFSNNKIDLLYSLVYTKVLKIRKSVLV